MFAPLPRKRSWTRAQVVSFAVHCLIIYLLVHPPNPIHVIPTPVMHGEGGTSMALVYPIAPGTAGLRRVALPPRDELEKLLAPTQRAPKAKPLAAPKKVADKWARERSKQAPLAGSPYGSLAQGPMEGHDLRPAYPIVSPAPRILRSELPDGVTGDVVVEVTIDAQGVVVATRVLETVGYGLEKKIVAALETWRFHPAMLDGRAIASQHDVHFHFPS